MSSAVKVHVTVPALCASAQAQNCNDLNAKTNSDNAPNTPGAANNPAAPRPR